MASATAPGAQGISNFKKLKLLGKGTFGTVFKVQRVTDGKLYALKETELGNMNQGERTDAVNEIRLLFSINHPNVVGYKEAFVNGNTLCIIMEYAPHGDLRSYITEVMLAKEVIAEEIVWSIFLQIARGLAALHANQVVHRDIKPANIFLCTNNLLKVGDLGVAKALTRNPFTSTQIGTPCTMAPEVWAGRAYTYSSDLWSLGCVLYEMMTFRMPMEGRNMQELRVQICSGRFTPIPPGRYSMELIGFVNGLLSLDPRKRLTAEQVLNNPASVRWLRGLPSIPSPLNKRAVSPLMNTIRVPRDLRQLNKVLPAPSYQSDCAKDQAIQPHAADRQAGPPRSRGVSDPGNAPLPMAYGRSPPPPIQLPSRFPVSGAPSPRNMRGSPGVALSPVSDRMLFPMPPLHNVPRRSSQDGGPVRPLLCGVVQENGPAPRRSSNDGRNVSPSYGGMVHDNGSVPRRPSNNGGPVSPLPGGMVHNNRAVPRRPSNNGGPVSPSYGGMVHDSGAVPRRPSNNGGPVSPLPGGMVHNNGAVPRRPSNNGGPVSPLPGGMVHNDGAVPRRPSNNGGPASPSYGGMVHDNGAVPRRASNNGGPASPSYGGMVHDNGAVPRRASNNGGPVSPSYGGMVHDNGAVPRRASNNGGPASPSYGGMVHDNGAVPRRPSNDGRNVAPLGPCPSKEGRNGGPPSPVYGGIARAMQQEGGANRPPSPSYGDVARAMQQGRGANLMLPPIGVRPSGGVQQEVGYGLLQAPVFRPARRITYS